MTTLPAPFRPGAAVRGLDRGHNPIADVLHRCGHHQRAEGRDAVRALLADTTTCPECNTPAPAKEAA